MASDSLPDANQGDPVEGPLRIMLIGKSGVGKSSSGNTILGHYAFKSDMRQVRVTEHCEKVTGIVKDVPIDVTKSVKDVPIAVIDTPGFFDVDRSTDSVRDILKCVTLHEPGPHAFVLVVPVGRMTREDQDTHALIEAKFGPKVWDYTIVLFTHGDRLEGKTINNIITESDENLRSFIRKCGGGFHVFNNKNEEDVAQVTNFIAKIQTMVALNAGGYYSTDMYPIQERKIRKRQACILKERDKEISCKEKQLEEHFKDRELEKMKMELWRSEENKARLAAERGGWTNFSSWDVLRFILTMAAVGLALWGFQDMWPLVPVILSLWILKEFLLQKFPWLQKKNS